MPAGADAGARDAKISAVTISLVSIYTPTSTSIKAPKDSPSIIIHTLFPASFRKSIVNVPPISKAMSARVKFTTVFIVFEFSSTMLNAGPISIPAIIYPTIDVRRR